MNKINLKSIVAGALIGLTLNLSNTYVRAEESVGSNSQTREASIIMDLIPDSFPGIAKVVKYPVEGAKFCLVDIKQSHDGSYNTATMTNTPAYPLIKECQSQIYEVLTNLCTSLNLKKINREGLCPQAAEGFTEAVQSAGKGCTNLTEFAKETHPADAVFRLVLEKRVVLAGPENGEAVWKAREVCCEPYSTRQDLEKYVWEDREDAILANTATNNEPVSVVVLGAAHNFGGTSSCGPGYSPIFTNIIFKGQRISCLAKDNIQSWNLAHPKEKFSLVEITPLAEYTSYQKK